MEHVAEKPIKLGLQKKKKKDNAIFANCDKNQWFDHFFFMFNK